MDRNAYSVPSRLIGEEVDVRLYAEHVEVWYGQRHVERMPRLKGREKHRIHYRHVIDWLVRKPGAFEQYRYREDLFPTSRFRMAYDEFCSRMDNGSASKEYLRILEHAARQGESTVDEALRWLIESDERITAVSVEALARSATNVTSPLEVEVPSPALSEMDQLLEAKEEWDGTQTSQPSVGGASSETPPSEHASEFRGVGASGAPPGALAGRARTWRHFLTRSICFSFASWNAKAAARAGSIACSGTRRFLWRRICQASR